jgi:transposase
MLSPLAGGVPCSDTAAIVNAVRTLGPFWVVIEARGTYRYRWLYDLLYPHGTILWAHPLLVCMPWMQRRTKTDKLDAQLLANLLRINQIPLAYIPPEPYRRLRDLARCRTRMGRELAEAKIQLQALLPRKNVGTLVGRVDWESGPIAPTDSLQGSILP